MIINYVISIHIFIATIQLSRIVSYPLHNEDVADQNLSKLNKYTSRQQSNSSNLY